MDRSSSPSPPRAGHLAVQGPSDDYVLQEIGNREFARASPAAGASIAHSFIACDPKAGRPRPGGPRALFAAA